jgi:hypothetical protein
MESQITVNRKYSDRFLTRRDAAEMLGLKPNTLAVWATRKQDGPRFRRHGRKCVYSERELLEWSERKRV